MKKHFLETLFVLAVASSNRLAELAMVVREDINFRGDSMVLSLRANFIVKNQGQGHKEPLSRSSKGFFIKGSRTPLLLKFQTHHNGGEFPRRKYHPATTGSWLFPGPGLRNFIGK